MTRTSGIHVLIYGSGGREHALAYLAGRSPFVERISCFPGNPGMIAEPRTTLAVLAENSVEAVIEFCHTQAVDLVIIGPEQPLADGWADALCAAGIPTFGPSKEAAWIESSKFFAKLLMFECGVPTAPAEVFRHDDHGDAVEYLNRHGTPVVVKADGLCAGKGAIVCQTIAQAKEALQCCLVRQEFGPAGDIVLIEDFLVGHPALPRAELSVIALVDRYGNFLMLPAAQDYKLVGENDTGPNTGGMGSFCPVPWLTPADYQLIADRIFRPVIDQMRGPQTDSPFTGALYAGLMWTADGPYVVEFNCRFGDPELQAIAMTLDTDLMPLLYTIACGGSIAGLQPKVKPGAAVCVVMASHGYPDSSQIKQGAVITGLDFVSHVPDAKVFQAGTKPGSDGQLLTAGGRVLSITCYADQGVEAAAAGCRFLTPCISWLDSERNGPLFRDDIGRNVPASLVEVAVATDGVSSS